MSEQTPSQAEGEQQEPAPDSAQGPTGHDVPRTTPSQAEGEDTQTEDTEGNEEEKSKAWESGWSGP